MAAAAGETADRRRVLLAGDATGNLAKLYTQVENQQKRVGNFDVLFAVGAFLPGIGDGGDGPKMLAEYVTGKRKAPIETYFVESRSAAMLQAAPNGKTLCEGVHFLGGFGIREVHGLRVAYLSGKYDREIYYSHEGDAAGPAFVGTAFTPKAVEELMKLVREPGAPAVDILLTAEWPLNLEERLEEAEKPKHPEGSEINWKELGVQPLAQLCSALEPRYHIFGTQDMFYQRPPFQTATRGHVCRCIALGKVGSKGKGRTWVHGLAMSPAASMPDAALKQRPENTTPSPFLVAEARLSGGGAAETAGQEENAGYNIVPDQIFLARLPPNIEEGRLEKALKHVGKIVRIFLARDEAVDGRPCRGFGWVTFSTPEEAQAACELSDLLECGGRKISICLSRPRPGAKRKREICIVIEPHADCWFCLVNPKVEKHMIVTVTNEVYIATARGPVLPTHVLVMPVKHAPCFGACPPELQTKLTNHVAAVRKMCHSIGEECIVWERWIPMGVSAANHMQIQVLPIPAEKAGGAREALEAVTERQLPGCSLIKLGAQTEVADHLGDDATQPYIYFEIPGDNTAKGRQVERYLYVQNSTSGGPRIPLNIGRCLACHLLGLEDKLDWRANTEDRDKEKALAKSFREQFKPFQPSAVKPESGGK